MTRYQDFSAQQALEIEIAELVADMRFSQGWSQQQLAEKVKTSQSAIARLESGKSTPSLALLKRVAKVFNMVVAVYFREYPRF